ncbi:SagB/ThcOx family dehydrogenase [Vallicoccus soli]|uniref:SagB/ThcOx family dehydrogenase n=2 Tax=Vallicoccus soli TaxID=2339232 RepID=A0A3A3Z4V3_9ACTN|nr:SagB/ThcOx family dehydrogenase [Vallicoccus soli]
MERTSPGGTAPAGPPPVQVACVRLSRFALLRTRGDRLVLESPLSGVRAVLTSARARALVAGLGAPQETSGVGGPVERQLVDTLVDAGLVEAAGPGERFPSEADPVLRQWDYHDLLAHGRVRSGSFDEPLGALYPYRGSIAPRPAVRKPPAGPVVPLHRPAWDEVAVRDPSLTAALEGRRSVRHHGREPLTLEQLGEFLWRVHRVRAHYVPDDDPGGADADEAVSRPYPSGGRAYELELYLTVSRCRGLDPGVYYHDPVAHRLVLVEGDPGPREAVLAVARRAVGSDVTPDVLVTVTSRFQRLSWKYRAIAYATTLRHTGVLYQTMYLVGTAMGLAGCALGNGDAALSARVLGLDYLEESSVGDFMLGSMPEDGGLDPGPHPGWHLGNGSDWPVRAQEQLP